MAPHFYNGNVEGIRDTGSDTTFFMMQKIGDLYTGAGLYGCTLNSSAGQTLYNSSDPASATTNDEYFCQSGQNVATTDVNDNWDRTEVTEGVDDVGSGAGQNQLCAGRCPRRLRSTSPGRPSPPARAARRWSRPATPRTACRSSTTRVNPTTYGTSTTAPYSSINGGVVGPVARGLAARRPDSRSLHGYVDNSQQTPPASPTSTAAAEPAAPPTGCGAPRDSTRITDWGALTNLGPNLEVQDVTVNSGAPDGHRQRASFAVRRSPPVTPSRDRTSPRGTTITSVSGGTRRPLEQRHGQRTTDTVRITTTGTLAVGSGLPDRHPDPPHGCQHSFGHRGHLHQLRQLGGQHGWLLVEHEHQRRHRPQPGHGHGRQRHASHRAGEQLGPDRPVRHRGLPLARTTSTRPSRWRPRCTSSPTACSTPTPTRQRRRSTAPRTPASS